jgi:hypothetical protein
VDSWAKVLAILKGALLPLVQKPAEVELWFDSLNSSLDAQRLAISLAIDLVAGAYHDETKILLAQVLDTLDYFAAEKNIEFGRRLMECPRRKELYCASLFSTDEAPESYVSVIHLVKFIDRAGSAFGYANTTEDKALIRRRYRRGFQARALRGYGTWWTGEEQIVWVTCADRFKKKWQLSDTDLASEVMDALGLPTPGYVQDGVPLEYVAVLYPPQFDRLAHQPTTLDAWWSDPGHWYLSTGNLDKWGRTQSLSGRVESQLERVHWAFLLEQIGAGYGLWYLGAAAIHRGDLARVILGGLDLVDRLAPPDDTRRSVAGH